MKNLIQKASTLGYKHYTSFTVEDVDKLPLNDSDKLIEYFFIKKWLRKKHNIDITVIPRFADSYSVIIHQNRIPVKRNTSNDWITKLLRKRGRTVPSQEVKEIIVDPTADNIRTGVYEAALEKGLQEALKLI